MKAGIKKIKYALLLLPLMFVLILSACQPKNPGLIQPTTTATLQKTATRTATSHPTATPTSTATPTWLVPLTKLKGLEIVFTHPWTAEMAQTKFLSESHPQAVPNRYFNAARLPYKMDRLRR